MKNCILFIFLSLLLCGCVTSNYFSDYYKPAASVGGVSAEEDSSLMPFSGVTEVMTAGKENFAEKIKQLYRDGYRPLGTATFAFQGDSDSWEEGALREQAANVGADIVLIGKSYEGSLQTTKSWLSYNPGQKYVTSFDGRVNNGNGSSNFYGSGITRTPDSWEVKQVPVTLQRYEYGAVFWRKARPPILGVYPKDLPPEIAEQLQRNTGAFVFLIVKNSPAFYANIVPGDIIVKINSEEINSAQDLYMILQKISGQHCDIKLLRNNKEIAVSVQTNKLFIPDTSVSSEEAQQ